VRATIYCMNSTKTQAVVGKINQEKTEYFPISRQEYKSLVDFRVKHAKTFVPTKNELALLKRAEKNLKAGKCYSLEDVQLELRGFRVAEPTASEIRVMREGKKAIREGKGLTFEQLRHDVEN